MCLSTIKEQYEVPSGFIQDGWKDIALDNTLWGKFKVKFDQWMKADISQKIKANDGKNYQSGFHVWPNEDKTYAHTSRRRVYMRFLTTRGTQDGEEVVIAREIYVPTDPNGWPPLGNEPDGLLDKFKKTVSGGTA